MSEYTLEELKKISPGTDWERVRNIRDEDIIYDEDSPDTSGWDWAGAKLMHGDRVIRVLDKKPVTLRLDEDILAWFKSMGPRYQTRINAVLRQVMEQATK